MYYRVIQINLVFLVASNIHRKHAYLPFFQYILTLCLSVLNVTFNEATSGEVGQHFFDGEDFQRLDICLQKELAATQLLYQSKSS